MKAKDIKFGIEIECFVPKKHGQFTPTKAVEVSRPDGTDSWVAKKDATVMDHGTWYGTEVVSPPLRGEDGIASITCAAMDLEELGAKTTGTCALHVHVDAMGMRHGTRRAEGLKAWFIRFELAFYALGGARGTGSYFQDIDNTPMFSIPSPLWDDTRERTDRTRSLNMSNLEHRLTYHGDYKDTIEIRCFAGACDVETVLTAVYMAVGLYVHAHNHMGDDEIPSGRIECPVEAARTLAAILWSDPRNRIVEHEPALGPIEHLLTRAPRFKAAYKNALQARGMPIAWGGQGSRVRSQDLMRQLQALVDALADYYEHEHVALPLEV